MDESCLTYIYESCLTYKWVVSQNVPTIAFNNWCHSRILPVCINTSMNGLHPHAQVIKSPLGGNTHAHVPCRRYTTNCNSTSHKKKKLQLFLKVLITLVGGNTYAHAPCRHCTPTCNTASHSQRFRCYHYYLLGADSTSRRQGVRTCGVSSLCTNLQHREATLNILLFFVCFFQVLTTPLGDNACACAVSSLYTTLWITPRRHSEWFCCCFLVGFDNTLRRQCVRMRRVVAVHQFRTPWSAAR